MPHRYSSALAHLVLFGTSAYCLQKYGLPSHGGFRFPHGTYFSVITYSLLGVWRWGNPEYGDDAESAYKFADFLQSIVALPCLTAEVWLLYGYKKEIAVLHTAISVVQLTLYLMDKGDETIEVFASTANCISLGVVSYLNQNFWGVAAAVSYFICRFAVKRGLQEDYDVPPQDLSNYGLCFFLYFSLLALREKML